ncbi:putative polynucleotide 5'-hydroxyl-kinase NOL9-like isoform X2 [Capsicum annuum]|nr:putative polynucleotide 5'-hydroxyl-kinase NOL9-like isoform X2 [Capsicum annuum]
MASVGSGELQSANIFIPQEWSDAADTIAYDSNTSPAPVALVCGPKNSGKTTLSRLLVNVLLQRYKKVAYLDTDVGQTEFTPPGLLSLTTIDKITSGIGYDILVDIIKYISPTHVVKICISAVSKNLPAGAFWLDDDNGAVATLIEVNSARQDSFNRSVLVQKDARLLRDLRVMAYFRQCFPSDMKITTIKELSRALAAHPPYEILISSIKIKHLHCEVPKSEVFYSLNATIVGLAVDSEDSENFPDCMGLEVCVIITDCPQRTMFDTPSSASYLARGFLQCTTIELDLDMSRYCE